LEIEVVKGLIDKKTSHLFLLIGTNPLPNLVSAILLSGEEEKNIHLLYSDKTKQYKEHLINVLDSAQLGFDFHPIEPINEYDPSEIYNAIVNRVKELLPDFEPSQIGLNYTGGTKTMAVHAYRAVKFKQTNDGTHQAMYPVLSYLDARTLSMIIEQEDQTPLIIPVSDAIHITLQEMLTLHDYCYCHDEDGRPILPQKSLTSEELLSALKIWGLFEVRSFWIKLNKEVISLLKNLPSAQKRQAQSSFIANYKIPDAINLMKSNGKSGTTLEDLASHLGMELFELVDYLKGRWLEDYSLDCLSALHEKEKFSDFGMDVQIIPKSSINKKCGSDRIPGQFQIDVFAIRGYQLFAISCSTVTDKKNLKQKLYQIYVHAKKMGGDEARVGLICGYESPIQLQLEIELEWQTENTIKVFGAEHIPRLKEHLRKWIWN